MKILLKLFIVIISVIAALAVLFGTVIFGRTSPKCNRRKWRQVLKAIEKST